MIITESENGESKVAPTIPSEGSVAEPQSPPPYSPSNAFSGASDQKTLPTPPQSPPSSSYGDSGPTPPADIPPACNHLIQRRSNDSIKGVWHIDTAMVIPDGLLAPFEEFDGVWNESDAKARKERKKLEKKGKRRSEDSPTPGAAREVRPNLMLQSKNGTINADVHVVSSDESVRPALIVAEGHNGSVTLEVRTYTYQPLRIFATSQNGSVRVRIPQDFEGAVIAHTKNGSLKLSDPIKSRMITFSAADTTRAYIGDWQSAGFGATPAPSDPNEDPPLPSFADPFSSWTGPLVHIYSHNGTVQLSYSDEEPPANAGEQSGWKGFMAGLFGGNDVQPGQGRERGPGGPWGNTRYPWGDSPQPWGDSKFPWGDGAPWGDSKFPWGNGPPPGFGGPFGRGGGPFARGGGPFGRGSCGRGRGFGRGGGWGVGVGTGGGWGWGCPTRQAARQREWGGGRVGGPSNQAGPSEEKPQEDDAPEVELDPYGFPKDRKEPPSA